MLDSFPVTTWFGNSVAIALSVAVLTVTVNLLAGYAFAHLRFRGANVLFLLALGTLVLPVQVIMVALFRLVTELHLYGSYWAVILPTSASALGCSWRASSSSASRASCSRRPGSTAPASGACSPASCSRCPGRSSPCCSS